MSNIRKRPSKLRFEFVTDEHQSTLGGLPALEALAQQFGLWSKIKKLRCLDPRKRTGRGYGPEVIVSQILYALCSGGTGLSDTERLNEDALVKELAGVKRFADESTVGEWLRAQTPESLEQLGQLTRQFVQWVIERVEPGRWLQAGQRELFFDDTQIEVTGRKFEGAKLNYEGQMALSWQTLWLGPFLLDQRLDSPGEVSAQLCAFLDHNQSFWQGRPAYFYADSGSSAGEYLNALNAQEFAYSVSYNKWTSPLERKAGELPPSAWTPLRESDWADGSKVQEQYAFAKHQPEGCSQAQLFAICRWKTQQEMFWRYGFVACENERAGSAQTVFERHHLKGDKERLFSEVLSGLDLHHPPCEQLIANQVFYTLGALAYNLLQALKLLHLPDDCQSWRVRTLLRQVVILPARLVRHARSLVARVSVPVSWLSWWNALVARLELRAAG